VQKKQPLIIFDMDGVLVDVSKSYREATRRTVILYMRHVLGADISDDFISLSDVDAVKKRGGLNNDWDLTDAILNAYLMHAFPNMEEELLDLLVEIRSTGDDNAQLQQIGSIDLSEHLPRLKKLIYERSAPALFSLTAWSGGERSPLLMNDHDVGSGNITKRIFQELYLGAGLFFHTYGDKPMFHDGDGYMACEHMIPTKKQLEALQQSHVLSIATGRPGNEASHALAHFGIKHYFTSVVTEDDVVNSEKSSRESLRKPHPFSLNLAMERCAYSSSDRVFYVGDMPGDMVAAEAADVHAIGFVNSDTVQGEVQRQEHVLLLENHGARRVLGSFDEIISYVNLQ
jgi:HAD superfamily hydrolase (TIGR01548 family)